MSDKVAKFIASLDDKVRSNLKKKLLALRTNPYGVTGVKKLSGVDHTYRLRVGKIRIIYRLDSQNAAEIIDIDYRGSVY